MNPPIKLVSGSFDPWKIQKVTHQLGDHPLLQIDSLVALGERLEKRKLVRSHSDDAGAGTDFGDAPNLHPNNKGAADTLAKIAEAKAWMSLMNIQVDPIYRRFVAEVLDAMKPTVEPRDPGMCYRAGWIFVTSPNAVTPFHMDHEHNFILQIRGQKRLHVWDPFDREVVPEDGQELFHDEHSREKVRWRDEILPRAQVFDLEPGLGGYMPSTAPHMVKNGDGVSITISLTYYTDSTRRRELLYRGNRRMRKLGLSPRPVGASPLVDTTKHAILSVLDTVNGARHRLRGRAIKSNGVPFAPV
ncbi:MAG: cupin-like domain-containing protein [Polyangiales bacterium]